MIPEIVREALRKSNSSEKPNNSTISKMEQVEDNDYREQLFIKVVRGFTCNNCKHRDVEARDYPCLECKGYDLFEPKDKHRWKGESRETDRRRCADKSL